MNVWRSGADGACESVEINIHHTPVGGVAEDITGSITELELMEKDGSHCMEFSFSVPDVEHLGVIRPLIAAGDIITFCVNREELYYFIVEEAERKYPLRKVSGRDFGRYFEKNEVCVKFSEGTATAAAAKAVFEYLGTSDFEICDMGGTISGVYIESGEKLLEEILEAAKKADGSEYDWHLEGKKVVIFKLTEDEKTFRYKGARNVAEFDIGDHHERMSYSHDISNLYTSVKAIIKSSSDELPSTEYVATDNDLTGKYGKTEKILSVNKDDAGKIAELAAEELKTASEIKRTVKVKTFGSIGIRRGDCIYIKDDYIGHDGKARVLDISQKFEGNKYTMDLELKLI